jgi:thymidine kinase
VVFRDYPLFFVENFFLIKMNILLFLPSERIGHKNFINHKSNEMFLENAKKAGQIEVICGSMFSGKTEELIRRMKRAQFAKQEVEIFKPCIDVRYSEDKVVSHDAHSIPSKPITSPAEMLNIADSVKVIGIDEAQFFDESIVDVVMTLANKGVRVIIAGLDTDFLGKPFGPMPALMAIAEDVQKVHAICVKCGSLANHSHRLSKSGELVVLGEKDIYEPLCRQCYQEAMKQQ